MSFKPGGIWAVRSFPEDFGRGRKLACAGPGLTAYAEGFPIWSIGFLPFTLAGVMMHNVGSMHIPDNRGVRF